MYRDEARLVFHRQLPAPLPAFVAERRVDSVVRSLPRLDFLLQTLDVAL